MKKYKVYSLKLYSTIFLLIGSLFLVTGCSALPETDASHSNEQLVEESTLQQEPTDSGDEKTQDLPEKDTLEPSQPESGALSDEPNTTMDTKNTESTVETETLIEAMPEQSVSPENPRPAEQLPEKRPECSPKKPCLKGLICKSGRCVACRTDKECPQGELCLNKVCRKGNCRSDSDCKGPSCSQKGTTCEASVSRCLKNLCTQQKTSRQSAYCEARKQCRVALGSCKDSQNAARLAKVSYGTHNLKYLPSGFKIIKTYSDTKASVRGLLVTSSHSGLTLCHVTIRGTHTVKDLLKLLRNTKRTDCKTATGKSMGSCSTDVLRRLQAFRNLGLLSQLKTMVKQKKCLGGVRITGHSMGGATASLIAAELQHTDASTFNKTFMKIYTFGEPRGFASSPADHFHSRLSKIRWMNTKDPIPPLPYSATGYKHYGEAREIKKHSSSKFSFPKKSQDASTSWTPLDGYSAHETTTYINRLDKCKL